jgi:hypothetical protein
MANKKFTDLDPAGANPTLVDTDIMAVTLDPGGTPVSRKTSISNLMTLAPQQPPVEGAFVDGDKTKLDGIEAGADVTDATNVQAAGALMDSEVTNLADVKAFDPTDYANVSISNPADGSILKYVSANSQYEESSDFATSAQGALADSAVQPTDGIEALSNVSINNPADGSILKYVSANSQYEEASLGTASTANSSDFATSAQGALADTAVQPTDGIETLSNVSINNPADGSILKYVSANSQYEESSDFATSAQGGLADTAVQPTDSIDVLADVDTSTVAPSNDDLLKWDGTNFVPGTVTVDVQTPIDAGLTLALRGSDQPHIGAYPNQSFRVTDNPYKSVMVIADEAGNLEFLTKDGANVFVNTPSSRLALAKGFSIQADGAEPDIEAVDTDGTTYSVISGDTDTKGANGLPTRQGFNLPDIGGNPAPILISGGTIA